jgi:hypothetical protein
MLISKEEEFRQEDRLEQVLTLLKPIYTIWNLSAKDHYTIEASNIAKSSTLRQSDLFTKVGDPNPGSKSVHNS